MLVKNNNMIIHTFSKSKCFINLNDDIELNYWHLYNFVIYMLQINLISVNLSIDFKKEINVLIFI